jgi:hypothetical protein
MTDATDACVSASVRFSPLGETTDATHDRRKKGLTQIRRPHPRQLSLPRQQIRNYANSPTSTNSQSCRFAALPMTTLSIPDLIQIAMSDLIFSRSPLLL